MFEIKNVYRQALPATRFIGRKYSDADRVNGSFANKWGEWFSQGYFETLEQLTIPEPFFEDSDAYIGLMRWKEGEPFEYWIGMFRRKIPRFPPVLTLSIFRKAPLGLFGFTGKKETFTATKMPVAILWFKEAKQ